MNIFNIKKQVVVLAALAIFLAARYASEGCETLPSSPVDKPEEGVKDPLADDLEFIYSFYPSDIEAHVSHLARSGRMSRKDFGLLLTKVSDKQEPRKVKGSFDILFEKRALLAGEVEIGDTWVIKVDTYSRHPDPLGFGYAPPAPGTLFIADFRDGKPLNYTPALGRDEAGWKDMTKSLKLFVPNRESFSEYPKWLQQVAVDEKYSPEFRLFALKILTCGDGLNAVPPSHEMGLGGVDLKAAAKQQEIPTIARLCVAAAGMQNGGIKKWTPKDFKFTQEVMAQLGSDDLNTPIQLLECFQRTKKLEVNAPLLSKFGLLDHPKFTQVQKDKIKKMLERK